MPVPTLYSESIFADYLATTLGGIADILAWDAGSPQVQEAVADALLDMGVSSISEVATPFQIRGLRAFGRRAIWRAVVQATAGFYAFTDVAQQQFSRQQINDQARKNLELAESDCMPWNTTYAVSVAHVRRPTDPYAIVPSTERVLP